MPKGRGKKGKKGKRGKKGNGKGKRKKGDDVAVASSDESSSSSSVAESNSGAVAVEGMAAAAVAESSLGAGAEGTGTEEVVDVQVPEWKREEKDILDVLRNRARGRAQWWGVSVFIYKFKYGGVDNQWYNGQTFLNTHIDESFTKDKPQQPIFLTYNKKIQKIVVGFTRYNKKFDSWINSQQIVQPDGYLPSEGVSMISDVLRAMSEVSKNSCKFVGLENMSSYVMLDNRIRILPFNIRRGSADKDADIADQLLAFSDLLLKKLYPKWKDVDLMEFISLMHEPDTTIDQLLEHPLLLLPQKRELVYRKSWIRDLSNDQEDLIVSIAYNGWKSKIPVDEDVLQFMLKTGYYDDDFNGAFKFSHDTSSHYMARARQLNKATYGAPHLVDSKLKKALPGLVSKIFETIF
uniref:Uncharacterized protein n=1 Tax=Oryza nivara TaxID=4536 RepID=A0A0E0ITE1_ORYNI